MGKSAASIRSGLVVLALLLVSCANRGSPPSGIPDSMQSTAASDPGPQPPASSEPQPPASSEPQPPASSEPQPELLVLSDSIPVVTPTRCDGLLSSGFQEWTWTADRTALGMDDPVQQITICSTGSGYLPGSGLWGTFETRAVPADLVPALTAALSVPDKELANGAMCAAVGYLLPDVVVRLADGRVFSARIPGDGCTPSPDVLDRLARVNETVEPQVTRDKLGIADSTLRSGCSGGKPFFPMPAPGGALAPMPLDVDTAYSMCLHGGSADDVDDLIGEGQATPSAVTAAIASLRSEPPPGCEWPPAGIDQAGIADYITLVPTPTVAPQDRPDLSSPEPVLTIATEKCHVAVDSGWNIVGWMDEKAVEALTASG